MSGAKKKEEVVVAVPPAENPSEKPPMPFAAVLLLAISPIEHDGVRHEVGAEFAAPPVIAARLIELGAAEPAAAD